MANSVFLARLIGPVMLAVGIGVFVNGQVYRMLADEFLRSRALIYLSGLLTMTVGMAHRSSPTMCGWRTGRC